MSAAEMTAIASADAAVTASLPPSLRRQLDRQFAVDKEALRQRLAAQRAAAAARASLRLLLAQVQFVAAAGQHLPPDRVAMLAKSLADALPLVLGDER